MLLMQTAPLWLLAARSTMARRPYLPFVDSFKLHTPPIPSKLLGYIIVRIFSDVNNLDKNTRDYTPDWQCGRKLAVRTVKGRGIS